MISPAQKVSQAYKSKSFNSYNSDPTPYLPRGYQKGFSESFPKEKSFKELLKQELQSAKR